MQESDTSPSRTNLSGSSSKQNKLYDDSWLQSPTKQENSKSSNCDKCSTRFTLIVRKHICKFCEKPVCGKCSTLEVVVSDGVDKIRPARNQRKRLCNSCRDSHECQTKTIYVPLPRSCQSSPIGKNTQQTSLIEFENSIVGQENLKPSNLVINNFSVNQHEPSLSFPQNPNQIEFQVPFKPSDVRGIKHLSALLNRTLFCPPPHGTHPFQEVQHNQSHVNQTTVSSTASFFEGLSSKAEYLAGPVDATICNSCYVSDSEYESETEAETHYRQGIDNGLDSLRQLTDRRAIITRGRRRAPTIPYASKESQAKEKSLRQNVFDTQVEAHIQTERNSNSAATDSPAITIASDEFRCKSPPVASISTAHTNTFSTEEFYISPVHETNSSSPYLPSTLNISPDNNPHLITAVGSATAHTNNNANSCGIHSNVCSPLYSYLVIDSSPPNSSLPFPTVVATHDVSAQPNSLTQTRKAVDECVTNSSKYSLHSADCTNKSLDTSFDSILSKERSTSVCSAGSTGSAVSRPARIRLPSPSQQATSSRVISVQDAVSPLSEVTQNSSRRPSQPTLGASPRANSAPYPDASTPISHLSHLSRSSHVTAGTNITRSSVHTVHSTSTTSTRSHLTTRALQLKAGLSLVAPNVPPVPKIAPKIIVAGPPGVGKSTQCEALQYELGAVHLTMGSIVRAAMREAGVRESHAIKYCSSGSLSTINGSLTDDYLVRVVVERIRRPDCIVKGWILDDFPRSQQQAAALAVAGVIPDCFILLDANEDVLKTRVDGRRVDPVTGKIYHDIFNPAPKAIKPRLNRRIDDSSHMYSCRYKEFMSNIEAVMAWYADILLVVDGSVAPFPVVHRILSSLNGIDFDFHAPTPNSHSDNIPSPISPALFPPLHDLYPSEIHAARGRLVAQAKEALDLLNAETDDVIPSPAPSAPVSVELPQIQQVQQRAIDGSYQPPLEPAVTPLAEVDENETKTSPPNTPMVATIHLSSLFPDESHNTPVPASAPDVIHSTPVSVSAVTNLSSVLSGESPTDSSILTDEISLTPRVNRSIFAVSPATKESQSNYHQEQCPKRSSRIVRDSKRAQVSIVLAVIVVILTAVLATMSLTQPPGQSSFSMSGQSPPTSTSLRAAPSKQHSCQDGRKHNQCMMNLRSQRDVVIERRLQSLQQMYSRIFLVTVNIRTGYKSVVDTDLEHNPIDENEPRSETQKESPLHCFLNAFRIVVVDILRTVDGTIKDNSDY